MCSLPPLACPTGSYGQNCQHTCLCQHGGTCDPVSGHCTCPEGWTGLACEEGEHGAGGGGGGGAPGPGLGAPKYPGTPLPSVGKDGFLPVGVASWLWPQVCGVTNAGPSLQRHGAQGSGWKKHGGVGALVSLAMRAYSTPGVPCPAECLPGHFGAGCKHSCRCLNGGDCDRHSGRCLCPAGWTGDQCQSREWAGLGAGGEGKARRPLWARRGVASALLQGGGPREVVTWQVGAGATIRAPRVPCGGLGGFGPA